ncbi:MAG: AsmA-like C-terminal domain-containing protein [Campylobacterota bacterium]|nr:AsmA-like C-terminal domain-containing protein [Campylobacterota bacterium]
MIKITTQCSIHVLHSILRNTLLFFIVIFFALFVWLKVGIESKSLMIGPYNIDGLYIKLDKKLTLKANSVVMPKRKDTASLKDMDRLFDKIKYLFTFFDYIELNNIVMDDEKINLIYADDLLYIRNNTYEIAGTIRRSRQKLKADISLFHVKKENIDFNGTIMYDLSTHKIMAKGNFSAYEVKGYLTVNKEAEVINFNVDSHTFDDLRPLISRLALSPKLEAWIVDKVQAKHYTLKRLSGKMIANDSSYKMDFDALQGEILFEDVKIFYKEGLDPILAKSFLLNYRDKALYFDLHSPMYKMKDMNNSTLSIVNLGEKNTTLNLDLHMKTAMDSQLKEILSAYNITLPIKHKGKLLDVNLKIDIPLGRIDKSQKPKVVVNVDLSEGTLWYKNIKATLKKGNVQFDNQKKSPIIMKLTLDKGTVEIGETKLPVESGRVKYADDIVTLNSVYLKEDWYRGKVDGIVELSKQKASLKLDIETLSIGDKEKFFVLKNKKLNFYLLYKNNVHIDIPSLDISIKKQKKGMLFELNNLAKIKPYLQNLPIDVDGGSLNIVKSRLSHYTLEGVLKRSTCAFYSDDKKCHISIPVTGTIKKNSVNIYAFNKAFHFNSNKSRITLKKLNFDLEQFLNDTKNVTKKKTVKKSNRLVILGEKSNLRYGKHTLVTDSYDIEIHPNGKIDAFASLDGDIVKFSKKGKNFSLKALRVKDKMLHPLIGFSGLKEGRYTFKKSGNIDEATKGQIIVEGGYLSDFKAYNNTLALLNTIPAIATLNNPGFSEKGFNIKRGLIDYKMRGDKIIFDSIYIEGESANFVGKGTIDLKTKSIDMRLAIHTARELGKIVGNLPLLGYILMGKDKSMTIGLTITGSLEQPIVETSAAKEILTLPIDLIMRTLESPVHIFNK